MNKSSKRKGFSLVELVVVILIIAILAAAIFLGGATVIKQARESQVKTDLRNLATYVQDMLYANPKLQYETASYKGEAFSYDPTTDKVFAKVATAAPSNPHTTDALKPSAAADFTLANAAAATTPLPVLKLLNEKYLTADFHLDGDKNVDAWDNPYCFSYEIRPATASIKDSACIIVINSLGANSFDETSDAALNPAVRVAEKTIDGLGTTYKSATDVVNDATNIKGHTGDDYGAVIVMIGGEVSTDFYGF